MKRYNHHGTVISNEHPQGQWCLWEDVAPLLRLAEDMACVLQDVDAQLTHGHDELAADVARQIKAWEDWYQ
jgi:hypothetical protein